MADRGDGFDWVDKLFFVATGIGVVAIAAALLLLTLGLLVVMLT